LIFWIFFLIFDKHFDFWPDELIFFTKFGLLTIILIYENNFFFTKFGLLTRIFIFKNNFDFLILDKHFDFWQKIWFLTKNLIFGQNFDFWQKFWFLTKTFMFDKNFYFRQKFWQKLLFLRVCGCHSMSVKTFDKLSKLWRPKFGLQSNF